MAPRICSLSALIGGYKQAEGSRDFPAGENRDLPILRPDDLCLARSLHVLISDEEPKTEKNLEGEWTKGHSVTRPGSPPDCQAASSREEAR